MCPADWTGAAFEEARMGIRRGVALRGDAPRFAGMLLLAAVLGAAGTAPAQAGLPGDVPDKVRIAIGGVSANAYTDAALGSTTAGVGASVNFEDIFGLPDSKNIWH